MAKLLMLKYPALVFCVMFGANAAFAQQDPQFSQYMNNRLFINPAYAGSEGALQASTIYRAQWLGFKGLPEAGVFSIDGPVKALRGGLGGSFVFDRIGQQSSYKFKMAYAYKIPIGKGNLNVGAAGSVTQMGIRGLASSPLFNFSLGAYYYREGFYAGFSGTNIFNDELQLTDSWGSFTYRTSRHYYFTSGYNIEVSENLSIEPSLLYKTDAASTRVDITALIHLWEIASVGASYRVDEGVALIAGLNINNFKLRYSYNITTSLLRKYSSGSHEISLGYLFNRKQKEE